jgi:hypothetical protein
MAVVVLTAGALPMRPTPFALAIVCALAQPGSADTQVVRDVLKARCSLFLVGSEDLFRPDVAIAAEAMGSAWSLFIDELRLDLPFEQICQDDPGLSVEEAIRAALRQAVQDRR